MDLSILSPPDSAIKAVLRRGPPMYARGSQQWVGLRDSVHGVSSFLWARGPVLLQGVEDDEAVAVECSNRPASSSILVGRKA